MIKRIGFACKWIDRPDQVLGISAKDDARNYSTGTTTIAWLSRQTVALAEQKLLDLVVQNLQNTLNLVTRVGALPVGQRMVRLSSEILPVYTHRTWSYYYQRADIIALCALGFAKIGDTARALGVRLSFHPGQFCCIVSANPGIVERSIEELEYHADMARWMGYGQAKLDYKINVHLSGQLGVAGFDTAWQKMSPELRNCLTLENDEFQMGLDELLILKDKVGIVLDVHHHMIRTHEYIMASDDRIKHVLDSWAGQRPVVHYSQSREDYLIDHDPEKLIDIAALLENGYKKGKLRGHSDFMWNRAVNRWARQHWEWADIMVEAKAKNIASTELLNQWQEST